MKGGFTDALIKITIGNHNINAPVNGVKPAKRLQ